jgi:hypothetical protein
VLRAPSSSSGSRLLDAPWGCNFWTFGPDLSVVCFITFLNVTTGLTCHCVLVTL